MSNSDKGIINLIKLFYRKDVISDDDLEKLNISVDMQRNIRKAGRQKEKKMWLCRNWDKLALVAIAIVTAIIGVGQCSIQNEVANIQRMQNLEPKLSFLFNPEEAQPGYVILNVPHREPFFIDFERQYYGKRKCKFVITNGPEKSASDILLNIALLEEPGNPFQISAVAIRDPGKKKWLDKALWKAVSPLGQKEYKEVTIKIDRMSPGEKLEIYCVFVYLLPKPQDKDRVENALIIELKFLDQVLTKPVIQEFPLLY